MATDNPTLTLNLILILGGGGEGGGGEGGPPRKPRKVWACPVCCTVSHLACIAGASLAHAEAPRTQLIPRYGWCETCGLATAWGNIVLGVTAMEPGSAAAAESNSPVY